MKNLLAGVYVEKQDRDKAVFTVHTNRNFEEDCIATILAIGLLLVTDSVEEAIAVIHRAKDPDSGPWIIWPVENGEDDD